ncbi:MAG: hypothetical protein ORN83_16960, partial [Chthoniobacteraceae bacterium]|nr:hypothetical protein [Chthoniobacteraceae bacterium]
RLGYQSHYLTLNGGTFSLLGAAGVGQRFSTLYLGAGASTVAVQNGGLGFTDVSSSAGSSLDFTGDFLSGGLGSISIVNPVYNGGIYVAQGVARARYTVGGTAFATLVPGVNTVLPFTAYNTSNALDIAAASDTPLLSNNTSYTASRTLNALALQGGVTLSGLQRSGALTLSSGGVLALAGMSAVDASAGLNFGSAEAVFHVVLGGTLNIAGMVAGSAGLTKTLNGTLQLSSPQMFSGMTSVNGGTLLLAGGNNTLLPGSNLGVNLGGLLDLGNTSQLVGDLINASARNGVLEGAGGMIQGSSGATLVTNQSNTSRTFAGSMQGGMNFVRVGLNSLFLNANNTFTGTTQLLGGL